MHGDQPIRGLYTPSSCSDWKDIHARWSRLDGEASESESDQLLARGGFVGERHEGRTEMGVLMEEKKC